MAIQYHIYQERIISVIDQFFSSEEEFEYSLQKSKNKFEVFVCRKKDTNKEKNVANLIFSSLHLKHLSQFKANRSLMMSANVVSIRL